ncbi:MAG: hypothetical protein P8J70_04155 [Glaciecola sp.]|nr:hypothetical protein [Glaciecola sp.]MDG1816596.1 hypothetical protein [Glaciecola sp.]MDG2098862.1 hypothetical protein [Glaciecola sp.]
MLSSHSEVIDQSIVLLQSLNDYEYQDVCLPLFSVSIGQHMRHIVDHFSSLMRGMDSQHVDYNYRSRQSDTETSLLIAISQLQQIKAWVLCLTEAQLDKPLNVISDINVQSSHPGTVQSSIARELVFCVSHAIHHYALVKIIRQLQGAQVDVNFGVAPATIAYQQSLQN